MSKSIRAVTRLVGEWDFSLTTQPTIHAEDIVVLDIRSVWNDTNVSLYIDVSEFRDMLRTVGIIKDASRDACTTEPWET